jgi:hypothetical protein
MEVIVNGAETYVPDEVVESIFNLLWLNMEIKSAISFASTQKGVFTKFSSLIRQLDSAWVPFQSWIGGVVYPKSFLITTLPANAFDQSSRMWTQLHFHRKARTIGVRGEEYLGADFWGNLCSPVLDDYYAKELLRNRIFDVSGVKHGLSEYSSALCSTPIRLPLMIRKIVHATARGGKMSRSIFPIHYGETLVIKIYPGNPKLDWLPKSFLVQVNGEHSGENMGILKSIFEEILKTPKKWEGHEPKCIPKNRGFTFARRSQYSNDISHPYTPGRDQTDFCDNFTLCD